MRHLLFIAIFLLSAPVTYAQDETDLQQPEEPFIDFNLRVDPKNPDVGIFTANTSDLDRMTLLEPRAVPFSSTDSSTEINCINGNSTKTITYGEAEQCDRIEWKVTFDKVDALNVNVSEQKNLYSETGWWTLFEWGTIPRIKEELNINVCTHSSDGISKKGCRRLPGENQAPLIFVWGKPTVVFETSGRRFRIFTDSGGSALINERTQQRLSKQYGYLSGLFPPGAIPNTTVDIAWVGIDEERKAVGGATGESAYISNYVISENNFEMSQERLFWVSGHESFHMISSYSYPLWISESLAHYFGYKSLAQHGPTLINPIQEWEEQKNSIPNSNAGLYEAHAKVLNKDGSYYGLFYGKGAAFWHDLDTRLENKGDSLNHYLSLLSNSQQENGELSREFTTAIIRIIGKQEFEQLASKYLQP